MRVDFERERALLGAANERILQGEKDMVDAADFRAKWDARETELKMTVGELTGTKVQLGETKSLLETTQTHTLDLQQKLTQVGHLQ
jgi:hypothetical protein